MSQRSLPPSGSRSGFGATGGRTGDGQAWGTPSAAGRGGGSRPTTPVDYLAAARGGTPASSRRGRTGSQGTHGFGMGLGMTGTGGGRGGDGHGYEHGHGYGGESDGPLVSTLEMSLARAQTRDDEDAARKRHWGASSWRPWESQAYQGMEARRRARSREGSGHVHGQGQGQGQGQQQTGGVMSVSSRKRLGPGR